MASLKTLNKKWVVADPVDLALYPGLSAYHPILRQLMLNRGIVSADRAEQYLRADMGFENVEYDPFRMTGMEAAVTRIEAALAYRQKIVVYGDYDVDGVTASAILVQSFRALSADVGIYIPDRFEEGYGLNQQALTTLKEQGTDLVITVDCGIRSVDLAQYAKKIGLDLIITDHHEPGDVIPDALAVINPKQPGDQYPEKYLAGVGIAYKLIHALVKRGARHTLLTPAALLDLVALGTVADVAPLNGENRTLVRRGLAYLRVSRRPGILALANVADVNLAKLTSTDIGFMFGPRINAAGRLDSALHSFNLLTATEMSEAITCAATLDKFNQERQEITRKVQAQAERILAKQGETPIIFVSDPSFNAGVVGLAAARLTELYYRPAIVGHDEGDVIRASCRSIPEFNINDGLEACADLLEKFGGHAAAAGLTVRKDRLDAFLARLNQVAAEKLAGLDLRPCIAIDMELPLAAVDAQLMSIVDQLEPVGAENPVATFLCRNLTVVEARQVGKESKHLKMTLSDGKRYIDAIAFRMGDRETGLKGQVIDAVFSPSINQFNGRAKVEMVIKDFAPASANQ
jgi:single-stranded-DNA-specific exonuclease RecJ